MYMLPILVTLATRLAIYTTQQTVEGITETYTYIRYEVILQHR